MSKFYRNSPEVEEFVEFNVRRMSVSDEFKPLLQEIILRRAIEFGFSQQDVYEDMSSLMNNLKEVSIDSMPSSNKTAAGVYFSAEKKIVISEDYVKNARTYEDFETLYEIFTHEVFHALARDSNGNNKISGINRYTKEYYSSLEEAIVEKAADRCVFGRKTREGNSPFFHQNKFGYSDITYITDIIEATYGVTEIAFLKHAIQGRENAADFLSDAVGEPIENALAYLDKLELNYARLHKTLYSSEHNPEVAAQEVKDSMTAGLLVSSWKMNENILGLNANSDDFKSRVSDFKYAHDKFLIVTRSATQKFDSTFPGKNISGHVQNAIENPRSDTAYRINALTEILNNRENIPEEDFAVLVEFAQNGLGVAYKQGSKENLFEKHQITPLKHNFIPLANEEVQGFRKMDFELTEWDNHGVVQEFMRIQDRHKNNTRRFSLTSFFKNALSNVQGAIGEYFDRNDTKLLGPGEEPTKNDEHQTSSFGRLSEEELSKFEQGMAQVLREHNSNQTRESQEQNEKKDDELGFE